MEAWRSCGVYYPGESGDQALPPATSALADGLRRGIKGPLRQPSGSWITVRIPFFPDGRCGVAVNGRAMAIIERPVSLRDSARFLIRSFSHRATILVGPLTIWSGVRGGVDWSVVERPPSEG